LEFCVLHDAGYKLGDLPDLTPLQEMVVILAHQTVLMMKNGKYKKRIPVEEFARRLRGENLYYEPVPEGCTWKPKPLPTSILQEIRR